MMYQPNNVDYLMARCSVRHGEKVYQQVVGDFKGKALLTFVYISPCMVAEL